MAGFLLNCSSAAVELETKAESEPVELETKAESEPATRSLSGNL